MKVIVSTTDDGKRLPEALLVQLERMGQAEGAEALDELLREARRTLQPWQRETAAHLLGVAPVTVYRLCGCGQLAHLRVSNAIRIRREDLQTFIQGQS